MSTSNKTDTAAESTSSNVNREITVEKDAGKNGTGLIKLKESKFYELIDWLKKWGYEARDTTKEKKTEGIEFQAQISPQLPYSSGLSTPFFLEFQKDLDDGFIIRTTFESEKEKRTFQWIMDGDIIENLEDCKCLGTRNGYRCLFEITGKGVE
ncbi:hypothetical protein BH23THE1_BH23THE1_21630 [soil metagenome]